MADLLLVWDQANTRADFRIDADDIATGQELATSVTTASSLSIEHGERIRSTVEHGAAGDRAPRLRVSGRECGAIIETGAAGDPDPPPLDRLVVGANMTRLHAHLHVLRA